MICDKCYTRYADGGKSKCSRCLREEYDVVDLAVDVGAALIVDSVIDNVIGSIFSSDSSSGSDWSGGGGDSGGGGASGDW